MGTRAERGPHDRAQGAHHWGGQPGHGQNMGTAQEFRAVWAPASTRGTGRLSPRKERGRARSVKTGIMHFGPEYSPSTISSRAAICAGSAMRISHFRLAPGFQTLFGFSPFPDSSPNHSAVSRLRLHHCRRRSLDRRSGHDGNRLRSSCLTGCPVGRRTRRPGQVFEKKRPRKRVPPQTGGSATIM